MIGLFPEVGFPRIFRPCVASRELIPFFLSRVVPVLFFLARAIDDRAIDTLFLSSLFLLKPVSFVPQLFLRGRVFLGAFLPSFLFSSSVFFV